MAELELLTLDELTELLTAFGKNMLPEDDFSRGSDNWKRGRMVAGAGADINAATRSYYLNLLADNAEGEALDKIGNLYGLPRLGASQASGALAGLVSGTVSSTWATTDALVHTSGLRYFPTASGTIGASGQELVGIIAELGGIAGNLGAGEIITWETPPAGIEAEMELQVDIEGGLDKEKDGPYRTRIINRIGQPAMGGNANDYEQWIKESSASIVSGYIWPNRNGKGSVDIAGLKAGSGSTRLLSVSERAALLAYVEALRPVHSTSRVLEVLEEQQAFEVLLTPESAEKYARDWTDTAPPIVLTWAASTRLLTFDAARPDSMAAGDRIVVEGTSGVELTIESLSGTDAVVIVKDRGQTPLALAEVYSGGPLVTPVRDAIVALVDSLGPRVDEYGAARWVSTVYHSHLFESIQTTEGVLNTQIVTPAADVTPTATAYPVDDSQINLITSGNVLVRYA
jgi:uncharacterized phage protein gp47/JayE